MREPSEEPAGLGERLRVVGPAGEDGGVREGGRGGRLGGLGDRQERGAGARERLDAALPVDRVEEHGGVEAERGAGARPGPVPAPGDPAGGEREGPARQQAVPVDHVVADLGRGEDQRDGGREAGPLALRDRSRTHRAVGVSPAP
jgi:hypothetical protein